MSAGQRKLVHKQFNSPMGLYSTQNVKETLNRELKAFGAEGIEIDENITKPLNLANSAVLRAVEEEEQMNCGYKRVAWPPTSEERIIREFTPQPQIQSYSPQPSYEPTQQKYQTPPPAQRHAPQQQYNNVASPNSATNNSNTHYNVPQNTSYPNQYASNGYAQQQTSPYQQPSPQQQQQQYQQQQPIQYTQAQFNRQPSREPSSGVHTNNTTYPLQPVDSYQQSSATSGAPAPGWKPITPPMPKQCSQYQAPGSNVNYNRQPEPVYQPQQQQQFGNAPQSPYQQHHASPAPPQYNNTYQQPQPQQQQQYQGVPSQVNQQPSWAHQQQQQYQPQQQYQAPTAQYQAQPQYQSQYQAPSSNYPLQTQPQQQQQYQNNQYNSYSQPTPISQDQLDFQNQTQLNQQQQQQPQAYRGASPGIMKLREQTPVSQEPAPVYASQPATASYKGGSHLRGDLKWPPPEYKEAAARENEERRQLALGPVCRPRKPNRDYTSFFQKNALSHHYPSYKVPPGTQHIWGV